MSRRNNKRGFGNFLTYWVLPVIAIAIPVIYYLGTQGYLNINYTAVK
ncbi:hypothetical protein [Candidatus Phytoplasma sp. AldY-WA1]|nr:hypothetical protein [Candidatus Phytoplasma sp. AldY-WA1]